MNALAKSSMWLLTATAIAVFLYIWVGEEGFDPVRSRSQPQEEICKRDGDRLAQLQAKSSLEEAVRFGGEWRQQSSSDRTGRMPIALSGKVYCKVDANYEPIEVGDLLVTSPTRAHAMRANDPMQAFGAVIGKALRRLESGCDLIPILVSLQ